VLEEITLVNGSGRQMVLMEATERKKRTYAEATGNGWGGGGGQGGYGGCTADGVAEAVDRVLRTKYSHLAEPYHMQGLMERALEAKKSMFQEVVRVENKRLLATIADYFSGLQVAVDRIGDVLAVQFGINLRSMHPEERRRYMAPAVNKELGRVVRQKRQEGSSSRMPPPLAEDASLRQAVDFVEKLGQNEMGRRMLTEHIGRDECGHEGGYTPRWGDREEDMSWEQ
jgi:hypothetical protein